MRAWNKYTVTCRTVQSGHDHDRDHFQELANNNATNLPQKTDAFFDAYLFKFHAGRTAAIYRACKKLLTERDDILSLASGHCAIELKLSETLGCKILCTDQYEPPWINQTKTLFPELKFATLDVCTVAPGHRYNAVLCFGLIYLFDAAALTSLFVFASRSVAKGGHFYLDMSGPPDNLLVRLFHNVYLPMEARLVAIVKSILYRRHHTVVRTFHGHHHSKADLIRKAEAAEFVFEESVQDGFDVDFQRSIMLGRLGKTTFGLALLRTIGHAMPYTTLLKFRRKSV